MSLPRPFRLALKFCLSCAGLLAVVLVITILMLNPFFVLYFILPVFVFFTVFTVAMRERDRSFPIREIMRDVFKLAFWQ